MNWLLDKKRDNVRFLLVIVVAAGVYYETGPITAFVIALMWSVIEIAMVQFLGRSDD